MKSIRPSVLLAALLCMILAGFIAYHVLGDSAASQPPLATAASKPPTKGAKGRLRPSAPLSADEGEKLLKQTEERAKQALMLFRETGKSLDPDFHLKLHKDSFPRKAREYRMLFDSWGIEPSKREAAIEALKQFKWLNTKELLDQANITDADIENAVEWFANNTVKNQALEDNLQTQLTEHLGEDRATELLDMMAQESRERVGREMKKYQASRED